MLKLVFDQLCDEKGCVLQNVPVIKPLLEFMDMALPEPDEDWEEPEDSEVLS